MRRDLLSGGECGSRFLWLSSLSRRGRMGWWLPGRWRSCGEAGRLGLAGRLPGWTDGEHTHQQEIRIQNCVSLGFSTCNKGRILSVILISE